jgi:hypothetical protein
MMAIARFGTDSDVYIYECEQGYRCERCTMIGSAFVCATPEKILRHLREHASRGDRVPDAAFTELRRESSNRG